MSIPPGAVPVSVPRITVGPAAAAPASDELIAGTAFDFGPSATQLSAPVLLTIRFDSSRVAGADRAGLALYRVRGGEYEEVYGSVVNAATSEVSAPISSLSSYAILRRAAPVLVVLEAGSNQQADAGTAVLIRPTVRVLDKRGRPVRFARVSFAIVSGAGSLTGATQSTDSVGVASVGSWTLGVTAGTNTLTAAVSGLPSVTFTATGLPASASQLVITTQPVSATAGTTLTAVVVSARDVNNNLATTFSAPVSIAVGANPGGSTLGGVTTVNAVGGVATFSSLTIKRRAAGYTLVASATGLTSATTIRFDIAPGPAAALALISGGGQSAYASASLGQPIVVQVTDSFANPVAGGHTVNFVETAGGGSVFPANATTDASGRAQTIWTLGVVGGMQSIKALSVGLNELTVTATALECPAPVLTLVSGGGQSEPVNTTLAPIVVKVSDCADRALSGEAVTFGVTSGGGSVTPSKGTGNSQGLVNVMWTLGPIEGPQTMTASVAGVQTNVLTIDATGTAPAGTILVTAPTTGSDPDDWYEVYVDSSWVDFVQAGSSVSVVATEGSHAVSLGGVAGNCTVAGTNPKQVTVTRNATTNVAFPVSCVTNPTVRVTVTTTGSNQSSGFTVSVDDGTGYNNSYGFAVPANGTGSVRVVPFTYYVQLTSIPANCTVGTTNPVLVGVSLGATVDVSFAVTCH